MSILDYYKVKEEVVHFLRNGDVFTVTERGVTTATQTATLASSTTALISKANVRNIRTLTIATVEQTYGEDYEIDFYYNDNGTRKTLVTFSTAQTGALSMDYDYGTDKIYPDMPQTQLTISDFPRIGVDLISVDTVSGGLGNVHRNKILFTVLIYSTSKTYLLNIMKSIRTKFINNLTGFYYLGKWVRPVSTGPLLVNEKGENKVFQQNLDFEAVLNYEIN